MNVPTPSVDSQDQQERPTRYLSHALVELRMFRHVPFFCSSAVILDISTGGFKLEFTGEDLATPGRRYWLRIPLSPLGISSPSFFTCLCECRWFDPKRFRMGGSFVSLSGQDEKLLEQIVSSVQARSPL